jgi:hypothetical protein
MEFLRGWKFDIRTAVLTVVVVPLTLFLLKILLKHLKRLSSYLLEGGMYWFSRFVMHSLAGALTLKRYCRLQLRGWNQYLHVPSTLDIKLNIDDVYVTLTLERQGGLEGKYNHTDLLKAGNRIRVIGDPGSGKSSLVKRLFRDACHQAIKNPRKSQLPIFVELKNLEIPAKLGDKKLGTWFLNKLREDAERSAVYQMGDCFDSYARTVGLLVLLDGLDEVSTKNYPRVQLAIQGLAEELGHLSESSNVVLTMRTQFHQQVKDFYRDSFALAMFLKAFSPSDIYEFLNRWPFGSGANENISRIYKDLTDRPTLREMCSNPLVLSMYVADDQSAGHLLAPETRTEFYSKVTEELIIRRRLQQIGPAIGTTKLREQRERILGRLAYEHLLDSTQSTNSLNWSDAILIVQDVMSCGGPEAEAIFRDLSRETGLITEERTAQSFRFIHLTFCEFLAAFESVQGQETGWNSLMEAHKEFQALPQMRSRLAEVIPFACGLLPRIKRYEAVNEIRKLDDGHLLALSFLETKLYDHEAWPQFVKSEERSLLATPEEQWDEQWLRRLHLFNVIVRDANNSSMHLPTRGDTPELSNFFKTLVGKQRASLSTLLSAYATQDAAAAFRLAEICNLDLAQDFPDIVISNCDQAPFFALIREQALRELSRIALWASLLAEAGLRSKVVAAAMMESSGASSLDGFVERVAKRARWFNRLIIEESLYTQFLTIAVGSEYRSYRTPRLDILRTLPPPGAMRRLDLSEIPIVLGFMMIMAGAFAVYFVSRYTFLNWVSFIAATESAVLILTILYMVIRTRRIRLTRGYYALLQLNRDRPIVDEREHALAPSHSLFERLFLGRMDAFDFLGKKHRPVVEALILDIAPQAHRDKRHQG